MNGESVVVTIVGAFSALAAIVGVVQLGRRVWGFLYGVLSFKNLSIGEMGRTSYRGTPSVRIKVALVGEEDAIVDRVSVHSSLSYPRRFDGFLAWIQLAFGYLSDDVEGLNTVLGRSPPYTGLIAIPVHRIGRAYVRKPLSAIWGIVILWYVIVYLFPLFWPVLFWGPYQGLKLSSGDDDVVLREKGSKVQLRRPFILKTGVENMLTITFHPSLYFSTVLMSRLFIEKARILYLREPPKLRMRKTRLPRNGNEFVWRVTDVVRVSVKGKMRGYSLKLTEDYVSIQL